MIGWDPMKPDQDTAEQKGSLITESDTRIADFLDQTCQLVRRLDRAAIARAQDLLLDCHRRGGRVFTAGNGGSSSTAQHFACDLAKFAVPLGQRPFDARCLTDNISLYTAWANDADRADVFVNLMRGLLRAGDVLIACSVHGGTGFSADLVRAAEFANEAGASTISLVGFDGGALHRLSTVSILVPARSTPQVEAIHLVIEHLLMSLLKQALGGTLEEPQIPFAAP
jgi:D-sedoheptulose 7-phosphate isomerase